MQDHRWAGYSDVLRSTRGLPRRSTVLPFRKHRHALIEPSRPRHTHSTIYALALAHFFSVPDPSYRRPPNMPFVPTSPALLGALPTSAVCTMGTSTSHSGAMKITLVRCLGEWEEIKSKNWGQVMWESSHLVCRHMDNAVLLIGYTFLADESFKCTAHIAPASGATSPPRRRPSELFRSNILGSSSPLSHQDSGGMRLAHEKTPDMSNALFSLTRVRSSAEYDDAVSATSHCINLQHQG
ncbi:hypothetical protein C8J57DRAFT_1729051 [Mycena rebaudengoi]|nr:hypothetical protein C8J57DRAFT_1729051 [Mycena rebaudengoi]